MLKKKTRERAFKQFKWPLPQCVNCKLYYQQLHLKYWCNLARHWLQAPWGWNIRVKTCRIVIICEIIARLLITVQNNNNNNNKQNIISRYSCYWCITTFCISLLKLIIPLSVPPHQFYNKEELKIQVQGDQKVSVHLTIVL